MPNPKHCLLVLSLVLGGCNLTPNQSIDERNFSVLGYQDQLNRFSQRDFKEAIETQSEVYKTDPEQAALKLALLYGHRKSPVKNPQQVKRYLDKALTTSLTNEDRIMLEMYQGQVKDTLAWQYKYEATVKDAEELELLLTQVQQKLNQLKEVEQLINLRENERD